MSKRTVRLTCLLAAAVAVGATACSSDDGGADKNAADTAAPVETDVPVETEAPVVTDIPVETEAPVVTDVPVEAEAPVATDGDEIDTFGALIAEAPDGLAFYTPPEPIPGEPGDIIWTREVGAVEGGTSHLVLYHSESVQGDPIGVSGLIFVPDLEAPAEGRPVFSWGNGTRGLADECANSRSDDVTLAIPILTGLLERNVVVVATDYEGLGTPGLHPYVIGQSEARGILDAARAAQRFTPADAGDVVLVGGQSQGGHGQAFANELSDDYAPELNIIGGLGTSAGVVTVDDGIVGFLISSPDYRGIMVMAMAAQEAAYGTDVAPPTRLLTEFGASELDMVERGCAREVSEYFGQYSQEELFRDDWDLTLANGEDAGSLNEAGRSPNNAPQLLIHTRDDGLVPAGYVSNYLENACAHGVPIEIDWWDGGHALLYENDDAQARALVWVDDRLAGVVPVDSCGDIPAP